MKTTHYLVISLLIISGIFYTTTVQAYGECTQYGMFSYYDRYANSCKCMSGYAFKDSLYGTTCVSKNSICQDNYGYMSSYNSLTGNCECDYGYIFGKDLFGQAKCISTSSYCRDQLGLMSRYSTLYDRCECMSGYVIYNNQCTNGETVCSLKHGSHSSYNSFNNRCECDNGYTFDDNYRCVKKQNNVYFYLKELDSGDKTAIIKSEYDNRYYKIRYGLGCLSTTFNRYLHKQIVVNLGTDFDLDIWDTIVLQDDDQTCDITYRTRVDSDTTLYEEDDGSGAYNYGNYSVLMDAYCLSQYGEGAIGIGSSCFCGLGYVLNSEKSGCIKEGVTCPTNSTLIGNQCYCNEGYVFNPKADGCVDYNTSCQLTYGTNTYGDAEYCYCASGYAWNETQTACDLMTATNQEVVNNFETESAQTEAGKFIADKLDEKLVDRLLGNIILQVEEHGEAWYLNPNDSKRYYMKDGSVAYEMMRSFGLGITDDDLNKIPISNTTDEIKDAASICNTNALANRLKGKILLQVQQNGEAFYVYPKNCRMIYMKDGVAAYQIMRYLGLGITNSDLEKIPSN